MNLLNLISFLREDRPERSELAKHLPNTDFDQIDVYVEDALSMEGEIHFFDAEAIPNELQIEIEGTKYVNIFPLSMMKEMIDEYIDVLGQTISNKEVADRLLSYRINDA